MVLISDMEEREMMEQMLEMDSDEDVDVEEFLAAARAGDPYLGELRELRLRFGGVR